MKKIIAFLMVSVICLSLCACGKNGDDQKNVDANKTTEATTQENTGLEATPVELGKSIENDYFKWVFNSIEVVDEFKYETSEYSSTSLYVEEGYKLLLLKGHIENVGTSTISSSAFSLSAKVNDSFEADSHDVSLNFMRSKSFELDPYTDIDCVVYLNIPEKLAEQFKTATFEIGFKDDMTNPSTTWNSDGTKTVNIDKLYSITGGTGSAATAEQTAKEIKIGETIKGDNYEFTLKTVEFSYEVLPKNTQSLYSSYPAESGKVYIHINADIKNTMERDIRIDELYTAEASYDGKYTYTGFTAIDDDNRFDWVGSYVAATPLETCGAHHLIECPAEVEKSDKPVSVKITIDKTDYVYTLR